MRRVLVGLAFLGVSCALANADPHNLSGGALITHYDPRYQGRYLSCDEYFYYPITVCDDQNNYIPWGTDRGIWYVIAAFAEDKQWCEVQFGFSDYAPYAWFFMAWEPCYPEMFGGFEITSSGWPGPGEGVRIVATDSPWEGNWLPVYAFEGYTYYAYGGELGIVQLVPDPTAEEPLGGFRNCASPPQEWDAALGGMGMCQQGTWVCWGPGDRVCCVGVACVIVQSEEECADLGGEYLPEWQDCGPPNPCDVTPTSTTNWGRLKALYR